MDYEGVLSVTVIVIELVAVAILAVGVAAALGRAVLHRLQRRPWETVFIETRIGLGRVLLLGLEVLIAADIIFTVALELTLANIAALGLLVLIRTFLSWAIEVETEGRWPWDMAESRAEERRLVERARSAARTRARDD
ncbi:MAG: DUF1622 domain-containing protein [Nitriliruptoraceae bacterium]